MSRRPPSLSGSGVGSMAAPASPSSAADAGAGGTHTAAAAAAAAARPQPQLSGAATDALPAVLAALPMVAAPATWSKEQRAEDKRARAAASHASVPRSAVIAQLSRLLLHLDSLPSSIGVHTASAITPVLLHLMHWTMEHRAPLYSDAAAAAAPASSSASAAAAATLTMTDVCMQLLRILSKYLTDIPHDDDACMLFSVAKEIMLIDWLDCCDRVSSYSALAPCAPYVSAYISHVEKRFAAGPKDPRSLLQLVQKQYDALVIQQLLLLPPWHELVDAAIKKGGKKDADARTIRVLKQIGAALRPHTDFGAILPTLFTDSRLLPDLLAWTKCVDRVSKDMRVPLVLELLRKLMYQIEESVDVSPEYIFEPLSAFVTAQLSAAMHKQRVWAIVGAMDSMMQVTLLFMPSDARLEKSMLAALEKVREIKAGLFGSIKESSVAIVRIKFLQSMQMLRQHAAATHDRRKLAPLKHLSLDSAAYLDDLYSCDARKLDPNQKLFIAWEPIIKSSPSEFRKIMPIHSLAMLRWRTMHQRITAAMATATQNNVAARDALLTACAQPRQAVIKFLAQFSARLGFEALFQHHSYEFVPDWKTQLRLWFERSQEIKVDKYLLFLEPVGFEWGRMPGDPTGTMGSGSATSSPTKPKPDGRDVVFGGPTVYTGGAGGGTDHFRSPSVVSATDHFRSPSVVSATDHVRSPSVVVTQEERKQTDSGSVVHPMPTPTPQPMPIRTPSPNPGPAVVPANDPITRRPTSSEQTGPTPPPIVIPLQLEAHTQLTEVTGLAPAQPVPEHTYASEQLDASAFSAASGSASASSSSDSSASVDRFAMEELTFSAAEKAEMLRSYTDLWEHSARDTLALEPETFAQLMDLGLSRVALDKLSRNGLVLEVEQQMEFLRSCLKVGRPVIAQCANRDLVVVLANTGAGKTTSINLLRGAKMARVKGRDPRSPNRTTIDVVEWPAHLQTEAGRFQIGHRKFVSQTFLPETCDDATGQFRIADLPGFLDTRADEIDIVNAAHIRLVLATASSIKILLLINYGGVSDRGLGIVSTRAALQQMFQNKLVQYADSFVVGVTHVPINIDHEEVVESLAQLLPPELVSHAIIVDPANERPRVPDAPGSAQELQTRLQQATPIPQTVAAQLIRPPLSGANLNVLARMVKHTSSHVRACCERGDFDAAISHVFSLRALYLLGDAEIHKTVDEARDAILAVLGPLAQEIQTLVQEHTVPARTKALQLRQQLQSAMDLDICWQVDDSAAAAPKAADDGSASSPPSTTPVADLYARVNAHILETERHQQTQMLVTLTAEVKDAVHAIDVCIAGLVVDNQSLQLRTDHLELLARLQSCASFESALRSLGVAFQGLYDRLHTTGMRIANELELRQPGRLYVHGDLSVESLADGSMGPSSLVALQHSFRVQCVTRLRSIGCRARWCLVRQRLVASLKALEAEEERVLGAASQQKDVSLWRDNLRALLRLRPTVDSWSILPTMDGVHSIRKLLAQSTLYIRTARFAEEIVNDPDTLLRTLPLDQAQDYAEHSELAKLVAACFCELRERARIKLKNDCAARLKPFVEHRDYFGRVPTDDLATFAAEGREFFDLIFGAAPVASAEGQPQATQGAVGLLSLDLSSFVWHYDLWSTYLVEQANNTLRECTQQIGAPNVKRRIQRELNKLAIARSLQQRTFTPANEKLLQGKILPPSESADAQFVAHQKRLEQVELQHQEQANVILVARLAAACVSVDTALRQLLTPTKAQLLQSVGGAASKPPHDLLTAISALNAAVAEPLERALMDITNAHNDRKACYLLPPQLVAPLHAACEDKWREFALRLESLVAESSSLLSSDDEKKRITRVMSEITGFVFSHADLPAVIRFSANIDSLNPDTHAAEHAEAVAVAKRIFVTEPRTILEAAVLHMMDEDYSSSVQMALMRASQASNVSVLRVLVPPPTEIALQLERMVKEKEQLHQASQAQSMYQSWSARVDGLILALCADLARSRSDVAQVNVSAGVTLDAVLKQLGTLFDRNPQVSAQLADVRSCHEAIARERVACQKRYYGAATAFHSDAHLLSCLSSELDKVRTSSGALGRAEEWRKLWNRIVADEDAVVSYLVEHGSSANSLLPFTVASWKHVGYDEATLKQMEVIRSEAQAQQLQQLLSVISTDTQGLDTVIQRRVTLKQEELEIKRHRTLLTTYFNGKNKTYETHELEQMNAAMNALLSIQRRHVAPGGDAAKRTCYSEILDSVKQRIDAELSTQMVEEAVANAATEGNFSKLHRLLGSAVNVAIDFSSHYPLNAQPLIESFNEQARQIFGRAEMELTRMLDDTDKLNIDNTLLFSSLYKAFKGWKPRGGPALRLTFDESNSSFKPFHLRGKVYSLIELVCARVIKDRSAYDARLRATHLCKMSTVWLRFDAEQSDDDSVLYRVIDEFVKYRKPKGGDRDAPPKAKTDKPKSDKPAGAAKITTGLFQPIDISSLANHIILLQSHAELGVGANMLGSKVPSFVIPPFPPGDVIPFTNCVSKLTGTDIRGDRLTSLFETFAKTNAVYLAPLKEKRVSDMDKMEAHMQTEVSKIRDAIGGKFMQLSRHADKVAEMLGWIFGVWTRLQSSGPYLDGITDYVAEPHPSQILSLLRLLGLDNPADLQSHLAQLGTGEGKSICLGVLSTVFALVGCHVECVCYSPYLSARDFEAFLPLFRCMGIEKMIHYGTMQELAVRTRDHYLGSSKVMMEELLGIRSAGSSPKRSEYEPPYTPSTPCVLLIDEVDVFFGENFYGSLLNLAGIVSTPEITEMLQYVWNNRDTKPRTTDAQIKALPCMVRLLNKLSHLKGVIENEINCILRCVQSFKGDEMLDLPDRPNGNAFCISRGGRIAYTDSKTGSLCDWNLEYWTYFAHCHFALDYHKGKSTYFNPAAHKHRCDGLNLKYGALLYSELPKYYTIKLGITGTLSDERLSGFERDILHAYDFPRRSFIPSIFEKVPVVLAGVKVHDALLDYHAEIRNDVQAQFKKGRATLVVFEDNEKLQRFEAYLASHPVATIPPTPLVLTSAVADSQRDGIITRATGKFSITLMTATFGRGCDFVCRDQGMVELGGLHVIQTWFSQLPSEQVQIMGRTGRQKNPGSYRLSILHADLVNIGQTDQIPESSSRTPESTLAYLHAQRESFLTATKKKEVAAKLSANRPQHDLTLRLFKDGIRILGQGSKPSDADRKLIVTHLMDLNTHDNNLAYEASLNPKVCRALCIMDATGSMSSQLKAAKDTIMQVFELTGNALKSAGRPANCFQLQFAVYRNYSSGKDILQHSDWESDPAALKRFCDTLQVHGGQGAEAVEIGLLHATKLIAEGLSLVLLVGDREANSSSDIVSNRRNYASYFDSKWTDSKGAPIDWPSFTYKQPLAELKAAGIPINAFWVGSYSETVKFFRECATETAVAPTAPVSRELELNTKDGAEVLTALVSCSVLHCLGGKELVKHYAGKGLPEGTFA